MSKVDLQSKADALFGEVNFLKYLFDMVSSVLIRNLLFPHISQRVWAVKGEGLKPNMTHLGILLPSRLHSVGLESTPQAPVLRFLGGVLEVGGRESPKGGDGAALDSTWK